MPKIEKTAQSNLKKKLSSPGSERAKTEKDDATPIKPKTKTMKDKKECIYLAAGSHLKSAVMRATNTVIIGRSNLIMPT